MQQHESPPKQWCVCPGSPPPTLVPMTTLSDIVTLQCLMGVMQQTGGKAVLIDMNQLKISTK